MEDSPSPLNSPCSKQICKYKVGRAHMSLSWPGLTFKGDRQTSVMLKLKVGDRRTSLSLIFEVGTELILKIKTQGLPLVLFHFNIYVVGNCQISF